MKRLRWEIYPDYGITQSDLYSAENHMSLEELKELNTKIHQIFGTMTFESYESRAFAEKMFRLGYVAAHMHYIGSELQ